jgi:predicted amidohydrolase YtcJ
VDGRVVDVRIEHGAVAEVAPSLRPAPGAEVVDGGGGALLPGLHDHHIHLLATAAAAQSLGVGPPGVRDERALTAALAGADAALPPGAWIRAVGYHESVAGDIDRRALDRAVPDRPVRVQHRGGARWILNSAAVAALGLDQVDRPGIERDDAGRATGRLHRSDRWLRQLLPAGDAPDLAGLGRQLGARGVTGVTDTTPYTTVEDLAPLAAAVASGALPQHVVVTGAVELAGATPPPGLRWGPVKIVIDDGAYPALDDLCDQVVTAHRHGRPVAVHCVTRVALVLALAAWDATGARRGDRVEHGAVVPPELHERLVHHGLTVVTQPGFVAERGDDYLRDVEPDDLPFLYPCASLLRRGIPVAASTDAPYTDADPWRAIEAARTRTTAGGAVLGADEAVPARRALDLFLGTANDPGGPPRRVAPGARADLCLLATPLVEALRAPVEIEVVATFVDGRLAPGGPSPLPRQ